MYSYPYNRIGVDLDSDKQHFFQGFELTCWLKGPEGQSLIPLFSSKLDKQERWDAYIAFMNSLEDETNNTGQRVERVWKADEVNSWDKKNRVETTTSGMSEFLLT